MWLESNHVVSVDNFNSADELCRFFEKVARLKRAHEGGARSHLWHEYRDRLRGHIMASLFYQPSTRTRFSFESAMLQLGGSVIGTENAAEFSSTIKGESLQDSVLVVGYYAHVIVIRHPEVGSAAQAAQVSKVPVINAGDGTGEHPTQALLDLYTIWEQLSEKHTFTLTLVGDLKRGRTVHSLVKLVKKFNRHPALGLECRIVCISPDALRLPSELVTLSGAEVTEYRKLSKRLVQESDVIYMTRTQSEHGVVGQADPIVLTPELAEFLRPGAKILHPLPRNEELPVTIDTLPQAHYFAQAENGLYVRMQLLLDLLQQ